MAKSESNQKSESVLKTDGAEKDASTEKPHDERVIGEVVSSSITSFVTECWSDTDEEGAVSPLKPRFGSFLRVDSSETGLRIFSVVFNVMTGSPDSVHKPSALRMSREQLRAEQPHIFSLLRTEVHSLIVGYGDKQRIHQHLPPQPPDVHDFVQAASATEIEAVTSNFDFLRLLMSVSAVPADELLSASVREAWEARDRDYAFLVAAGQSLSQLLKSDYDRLVSVLRKIRPS